MASLYDNTWKIAGNACYDGIQYLKIKMICPNVNVVLSKDYAIFGLLVGIIVLFLCLANNNVWIWFKNKFSWRKTESQGNIYIKQESDLKNVVFDDDEEKKELKAKKPDETTKVSKESKEIKENKQNKESKDSKDAKDSNDAKVTETKKDQTNK